MPHKRSSNRPTPAALAALFLSAAAMPYLTATEPAAATAAAKPVAALGVGSVAEFLVQRLVSPNAKPGLTPNTLIGHGQPIAKRERLLGHMVFMAAR